MRMTKLLYKAKSGINILSEIVQNYRSVGDIYYIIERADWSIRHDGVSIASNLKRIRGVVTANPLGIRNSIVHFGSINTFFANDKLTLPHRSNKIVVTWFHVSPGDSRISFIPTALKHVDLWHTSCILTKKTLLEVGIPESKIIVIPLGVNLKVFKPSSVEERTSLKQTLGIPEDKIIIGSFQKDGVGWEEGLEPKLIKGPDIFCDAVERLSKKYPIFVLLTGPARGYVKERLMKANIPFLHKYLEKPDDVSIFYKIIDLYLMTSRVEGGPKSILESLASGVPLISTRVGMACDIINNSENGFLVDKEDVVGIVNKASLVLENHSIRSEVIKNGIETSRDFGWDTIARRYESEIYSRYL